MARLNAALLVLAEQITVMDSSPKWEKTMTVLVGLAVGVVLAIAILAGKI